MASDKEKKKKPPASPSDDKPTRSTSKLVVRQPSTPAQTQSPDQQTDPRIKASQSEFENQLWEMEAEMSQHLTEMEAQVGSEFSKLSDELSDMRESLHESMDGLEDTVGRFITTMKWYIALAAITSLVGVAFLIWQIFFL
jgi:hypothetical protein